jgi:hypothetical protein
LQAFSDFPSSRAQDGRIAAINTGKPELTGWNMWFGDPQHSNLAASR